MPAITPVPPSVFKAILEKYSFDLVTEDEFNWTLFKKNAPRPIIIVPKEGEFISIEIMMRILDQLSIDNKTYFELLQQVTN